MNKSGRVLKGDTIVMIEVLKETIHVTPSTGTTNTKYAIKTYQIHSPYDGVINSRIPLSCSMSKFPICNLKPGSEEKEDEAKKQAVVKKYGIAEDYYNEIVAASKSLASFRKSLCLNIPALEAISGVCPWQDNDKEAHFNILISVDALKCVEQTGAQLALDTKEGFGLMILSWALISKEKIPEYKDVGLIYKTAPNMADFIQSTKGLETKAFSNKQLVLADILASFDSVLKIKYLNLLKRWTTAVAKADGNVTEKEKRWLEKLTDLQHNLPEQLPKITPAPRVEKQIPAQPVQRRVSPIRGNPMKELKGMIGLSSVKSEIETLYNFIKVQKMRQDSGLSTSSISYHCVFTGNPGTGKTTVARIVAKIYRDLGVLQKGHLVETDRSGLVAEYVGQTAVKTNKVIDSALDGVLFIDEAYSLAEGGQGDFGREAIATLLKRMEDDRDRLVVILAGYSSNMKHFIDSNPGLQSRFNRYIDFPDYTASELYDIFMLSAKKNDYVLTEEAEETLKRVLNEAVSSGLAMQGNGRYVRNLFEKAIQRQANRVAQQKDVTSDILRQILASDIAE